MADESSVSLRLAVVGAGQIVRNYHVPALLRLGHRIVFAADPSGLALSALRTQLPPGFTGVLTDRPDIPSGIDAVLVASPSALHASQVQRLLEAGHSVFCEKPLATRGPEAAALSRLAQDRGLILQVGYYRRHHPALRQLGSWLRSNLYGPPRRIRLRAGHIANDIPESFLQPAIAGGGVLIDFGVHAFDLLLGWCDEVRLSAYSDDAHPGGMEANACANLTARINDWTVPVLIELSRTSPLGYFVEIEFADVTVRSELNMGHELVLRPGLLPDRTMRVVVSEPLDTVHYFAEEWQEFSERLEGAPERIHRLGDAVRATELAEACYADRRSLVLPWGD